MHKTNQFYLIGHHDEAQIIRKISARLIHQKLKFSTTKFIQYDFVIPNNADSSASM